MAGPNEPHEPLAEGMSRRSFMTQAALGVTAVAMFPPLVQATDETGQPSLRAGFPVVDYHVHLSGALTIDKAVELSHARGVKFGIVEHPGPDFAIEINEFAKVPKARFITLAKNAGVKFTFGTDSRDQRAGKLEYCLEMTRQCGLNEKHMFSPKPNGQRAIQRAGRA